MPDAVRLAYVTAFLARCRATASPRAALVEHPGLCGGQPAGEDGRVRLLVLDDCAIDELHELLSCARTGIVSVFPSAPRSAELVARELGWKRESVTPMVCRDLSDVPALGLPPELTVRAVRRLDSDPSDGVPLADAVAVAMQAQRDTDEPYAALADHLRAMPSAIKLFAATDDGGVPRATSGCGVFGPEANVLFVNTEPGWRERGIGSAMTAVALRAARLSGAERASLDASDAGVSIYSRLSFQSLAPITRFVCVR